MPNESTETVVRFGRDRIRGYYIFGALLLLIVVLNLAVGFWIEAGPSERHRSTIDMLLAVLRQPKEGYVRRGAFFAVTMGLALFAAVKLFQAARVFARAFVAIGPDSVTLRLVRKQGQGPSSYSLLPEQRFAWDAIHTITYTEGYCRFVVHGDAYLLDADICPSPGTVARLMAERKGTPLPAETVPPPSGKQSTLHMTRAAITGGIGLGLSGAVALGAWWVYHHVGGPFYVAEFLSLVLFGVVALTLFSTGMVLALIELNHRFQ
jgi:hypothetical protein